MLSVARDCFSKHPEDLFAEGKGDQLIEMVALRQIENEEWDERMKASKR